MARKTHVVLIDDLDGSEATKTVQIGYAGVQYELDLNSEHAEELELFMEDWIKHARRIGGRSTARRPARGDNNDNAKIREWANQNGHQVSARGRIAAEVREAYYAAVGR